MVPGLPAGEELLLRIGGVEFREVNIEEDEESEEAVLRE